jgi:hypothetical protein
MSRSLRTVRTLAWVSVVGLLAVAPLSAAVYTVTLKNGGTFESRYQPEDASWDKTMIVFLDEWGNTVALPKDQVDKVESDFEAKGYGKMIDNTTMSLGWAPNDAATPPEEGEEGSGGAPPPAQPGAEQQPNVTYDQFVEPGQTQGMPAQWIGYPTSENLGSGTYDRQGGGAYVTPPYAQPSPQAGTTAPEK